MYEIFYENVTCTFRGRYSLAKIFFDTYMFQP